MTISVLLGVVIVIATLFASYRVANSFWSSAYSRTNHSGDFGGPSGGVFAVGLLPMLAMALVLQAGKYLLAPQCIAPVALSCLIAGGVAGLVGAFRAVTKDKNNKQ